MIFWANAWISAVALVLAGMVSIGAAGYFLYLLYWVDDPDREP